MFVMKRPLPSPAPEHRKHAIPARNREKRTIEVLGESEPSVAPPFLQPLEDTAPHLSSHWNKERGHPRPRTAEEAGKNCAPTSARPSTDGTARAPPATRRTTTASDYPA